MTAVGARHPMLDGAAKVTGALKYTADMEIAGLAQACLRLSPHAHARVLDVSDREARRLPGYLGVFWHANMPAHRYNSGVWYSGQEAPEDETLFFDVARYVGDPVAVVVAEDAATAQKAAALIDVTYSPLPAILDPEQADGVRGPLFDATGAPLFNNPVAEKQLETGDVAAGFAAARHIVETEVTTPKTHHAALENHAAVAIPEADGRIRILTPCQSVHAVQLIVAKALGVAAHRIHVVKTPIGGSFGGKAEPVLDPIVAALALRLGRPVALGLDREQTFTATRVRASARIRIRTGFDADGRMLARQSDALIDVGAYATGGNHLPGSMLQRHVRLYDLPAQRYRGRAVYTNTIPSGAFRGYGSPQVNAAGEIHLDLAAREMGIDPVALRLRNAIGPGAIEPYSGLDVGNARLRECITEGAERFGWAEKRARPKGRGRYRYGTAMAAAAHINGCFPGAEEATTMTMRLARDGRVEMVSALHDLGCGSNTTLAQIAGEVLAVAPGSLRIVEADTDLCGYDLGTRASRMIFIAGEATRRTSLRLAEAMIAQAALLRNVSPGDLTLSDGGVIERQSGARITLARLARDLGKAGLALPEVSETYRAECNPSSHAAHFASVRVDTLTGLVHLSDYLAAHDCGRAINPMLVEGQIHGGVQIGIGYALFEDVAIDCATGAAAAHNFARYAMANSLEMPDIAIHLVDTEEASGPFGAKAVGEIATIPVAAAVVNAVNDALGTALVDLPLTPERILDALG